METQGFFLTVCPWDIRVITVIPYREVTDVSEKHLVIRLNYIRRKILHYRKYNFLITR